MEEVERVVMYGHFQNCVYGLI